MFTRKNTACKVLLLFVFLVSLFSSSSFGVWRDVNSGTTSALRAVSFFDDTNGIAVGDNGSASREGTLGKIIKTSDGGNSWTSIGAGTPYPIKDVKAVTATNAFMVTGSNSHVYKIDSFSDTLSLIKDASTNFNQIYGLHTVGENTIFIVGYGSGSPKANFAKLQYTGGTWHYSSTQEAGSTVCFSDAWFFDSSTGIVVGGGGEGLLSLIYKTQNGGSSFQAVNYSFGFPMILDIHSLNLSNTWALRGDGAVFYSGDAGNNWDTIGLVTETDLFFGIKFITPKVGFVVGSGFAGIPLSKGGGIFRTLDGGKSWKKIKTGNFLGIDKIGNMNKLVAVGTLGAISVLNPPEISSISKVKFLQGTIETISIFGTGFESQEASSGFTNPTIQFNKNGISVESVNVLSSTEISATIKIDSDAEIGQVKMTLINIDTTQATSSAAFSIGAGESGMSVISVVPGSAYQGETVKLAINGANIPNTISSGSVLINLGAGISASFVTFETSNIITAIATLEPEATTGAKDITITVKDASGEEVATATKTSAFTVMASANPGTLPDPQSILPKISRSGVWNPPVDGDLPVQVKVPVAGSYNVMVGGTSGIKYKTTQTLNVGYNKIVIPSNLEFTNGAHVLILQDPRTGKMVKAKFAVNQ